MNEGDTQPSAGRWIERYSIQGCGMRRIYNAISSVDEAGGMSVVPVVPGRSARDFDTLHDLRPFMEQAAEIENCENKTVVNTAVGAPNGYETLNDQAQYETWYVMGCGVSRALVLAFSVDKNKQINIAVEKQLEVRTRQSTESMDGDAK